MIHKLIKRVRVNISRSKADACVQRHNYYHKLTSSPYKLQNTADAHIFIMLEVPWSVVMLLTFFFFFF